MLHLDLFPCPAAAGAGKHLPFPLRVFELKPHRAYQQDVVLLSGVDAGLDKIRPLDLLRAQARSLCRRRKQLFAPCRLLQFYLYLRDDDGHSNFLSVFRLWKVSLPSHAISYSQTTRMNLRPLIHFQDYSDSVSASVPTSWMEMMAR